MTDLARLGLALIGFAAAVAAGGTRSACELELTG